MLLLIIASLQSGEEGTRFGLVFLCFVIIMACIIGFFNMK